MMLLEGVYTRGFSPRSWTDFIYSSAKHRLCGGVRFAGVNSFDR